MTDNCKDCLIMDALKLANRQQREIERLEALNDLNLTCSARKQEAIEHLEVELKAMRGAANSYKQHYGNMRMEIAREFADRLKKEINIRTTLSKEQDENIIWYIDNLLKEMEAENGSEASE